MNARRSASRRGVLAGAALWTLVACNGPIRTDAQPAPSPVGQETISREPLEPLSATPSEDPRRIVLGRKLFHERRLSLDGAISCASCHDLDSGGADGRRTAVGIHGQLGTVNAPTVYNAGLNFVQFWDGRAATLEDQVNGPLTNPLEMGSTWDTALHEISADADYRARFASAYPDGITADNVRNAIASFERALVAVDSPFDRWLGGDSTALSAQQKAGYDLFKGVGCIACHQGRNVGGNMFQRFGIFGDYFADRGHVTEADYGRFNVTRNEADRFVFRVPSLRYASLTAPYFHDGSAPTLPRAVQVMARYQLGRTLTGDQVDSIVAFITSLAGPRPAAAAD